MNRLVWLDYLRGFCAIGIMLHHYIAWITNFSTPTTRIGLYCVSIFYILSGLTLYHVYRDKMEANAKSVASFFIKRVFRLYPCLWIATILTIWLKTNYNLTDLFLNLTGLFGFIKWDGAIGTGVWSIGNELVFYTFFPLMLLTVKFNIKWFIAIGTIFLSLYLYFAFYVLDNSSTLSWRDYVNPFNQIFLFFAGFLLGLLFHTKEFKNSYLLIGLFLSITIFSFYPISGDRVIYVSSYNRIIFTIICLSISFFCYKLTISLPKLIDYPLKKVGEATYSIYLFHPIIWILTKPIEHHLYLRFIIAIIITIAISLILYFTIEKKFINIGHILCSKLNKA